MTRWISKPMRYRKTETPIDSCDEFRRQMNQVIDQRDDPQNVRAINRHARNCDSCACELNAWVQIQSLYAPVVPKTQGTSVPWGFLAMTAAAITFGALGTFFAFRERPENLVSTQTAPAMPSPSAPLIATEGPSVERWLNQVDTDRWIDHTMPAVRNVGEGVAPLGRSLRQAVSILAPMNQSSTRPQPTSPMIPPAMGFTL